MLFLPYGKNFKNGFSHFSLSQEKKNDNDKDCCINFQTMIKTAV